VFEENTLTTEEEALKFINKYGIVTLVPVRNLLFPSLYKATRGNHQEKFENAWKWADDLAYKKLIHYGKLVQTQVTLFSLEVFPYFYKLYRKSQLNETAQQILDYLKQHGPTSTTVLRKSLNLWEKTKKNEFVKAVDQLQVAMAIAIVSREKPPKMTHMYDLIERWMPKELLKKAESTTETVATERIVAKMLENRVISRSIDLKKILPCKMKQE